MASEHMCELVSLYVCHVCGVSHRLCVSVCVSVLAVIDTDCSQFIASCRIYNIVVGFLFAFFLSFFLSVFDVCAFGAIAPVHYRVFLCPHLK